MISKISGLAVSSLLAIALMGCAGNAQTGQRPDRQLHGTLTQQATNSRSKEINRATPLYDWDKRIFTLSIFANLATGKPGSRAHLERLLSKDLSQALKTFQPELGEWEVVWGPMIYQAPGSDLADNAIYVARQRSPASQRGEYVVAIAAVNSKSFYDWFVEQLNVTPQVAWGGGVSRTDAQPRISRGVQIGFSHLANLDRGKTLMDVLNHDIARGSRITVAGHSYGGAVAPVMALWMEERQKSWDPNQSCEIACLLSGAPTPGNSAFADYYARRGLGKRTTRIDNSLDMAWRAFNAKEMQAIPSLYSPHVKPSLLTQAAIAKLRLLGVAAGGYAQIKSARHLTIKGVFAPEESPQSDATDIRFLKQVTYQHIPAYFSGLGLTKLADSYREQSSPDTNIHFRIEDIIALKNGLYRLK